MNAQELLQEISDYCRHTGLAESTFGRRLPIGAEETIKTVGREDFRDYYARWYVPSNMTVIVVGDADPALIADLVRQHFGGGPTVPRPTPREVLMDKFWPDACEPELARNSLNVAVSGLRRALRALTDQPVIVFENGAYQLNPEFQVWVDAAAVLLVPIAIVWAHWLPAWVFVESILAACASPYVTMMFSTSRMRCLTGAKPTSAASSSASTCR